jgi:hypothetical protein
MGAVGYHSGSTGGSAQQVSGTMLFQKLAGLVILGSGYVVLVASLVHAVKG